MRLAVHILWAGLALGGRVACGEGAGDLTLAFPPAGAHFQGIDATYAIGAVPATNGFVTVNGATGEVYRTGAFLAMAPLAGGTNVLTVVWGTNTLRRQVVVTDPKPAQESSAEQAPVAAPPPAVPGMVPTVRNVYADLDLPTNAVFDAALPAGRRPGDVYVMVDPGHGGSDTGAVSPHGWPEKEVNLQLAREIRRALRRQGFKVVMTRDDDSFPPLYFRPKEAIRLKADLFISVHHNATKADVDPRQARHVVTYASNEKGLKLAAAVARRLGEAAAPVTDRGAALMSLAVCRNPVVPSCLIEADFINLPEGEEAAWDPARQRHLAEAVARGVLDLVAGDAP